MIPIPLLLAMGSALGGSYMKSKRQEEQDTAAREQVKGLLGSPGQYTLPADQAGPQVQGRGLLGGEMTNRDFAAQLLAIPGYEQVGAKLYDSYTNPSSTSPYYTALPTSTGYLRFNNRTGESAPLFNDAGGSALPIAVDPRVQANVTAAKTAAEVGAKQRTAAAIDLPQTISNAEQTISLIDKAISHPGRETATGASSKFDPRNYLAGTEATNFGILMDQLKGKSFLQAFESLKGGGQITEVEGKKAQDAIARMNTAQSDEEFVKSLQELRVIVQAGMERARQKAGVKVSPAPGVNTAPQVPSGGGWGIRKL